MIEVNNLTTSVVEEDFLKGVAKNVLKGENRETAEISIALFGEGRNKSLNKKHRKKNRVTDVLSFSNDQGGEVAICLKQVRKNAKQFGVSFEKELAKVLIHGILHIFGFDHQKKEEAGKMEKKEKEYLNKLSF